MSTRCADARRWLAEATVVSSDALVDDASSHAAHIRNCPECRELLRRYLAFAGACRAALEYTPGAEAEARLALAARSLRGRSREPLSLVDETARVLDHPPSEDAEARFLEAVRAQQAHPAVARLPRRGWRPMVAAVAAFVLVVGLWGLWSQRATSPSGPRPAIEGGIAVVNHSGRVLVDDVPVDGGRAAVAAGASIVTGESGRVSIGDEESAVVAVSPRSAVEVETWTPPATRLLLREGTLRVRVAPRKPGAVFEVRTANARITVVGTEFTVRYTMAGDTVVRGISGQVHVAQADDSPVGVVTAGVTLRVEARGLAPTPSDEPAVALAGSDRPEREVKASAETAPPPREASSRIANATADPEAPKAAVPRRPARASRSAPPSRDRAPRIRPEAAPEKRVATSPPEDEAPAAAPDQAPTKRLAMNQLAKEASSATRVDETAPCDSLAEARVLLAQGHATRAVEMLRGLSAADWRREALLGDAYQVLGHYEQAERAYREAYQEAPDAPSVLLADLATLQQTKLKRPEAAAESWQRYLEVVSDGPDVPRARLFLGRRALENGREDEAERHLGALMEGFPEASQSAAALALLGARLFRAERWAKAEALFEPHVTSGMSRVDATPLLEIALVGLIRVRIAQGDQNAAHGLIEIYRERFKGGAREPEIERLEHSLSAP